MMAMTFSLRVFAMASIVAFAVAWTVLAESPNGYLASYPTATLDV